MPPPERPRFDPTPEPSACLLCQILKIQGVHRALQADVQVADLAFRDGDDLDARERQLLEQVSGVFLVA